MDKAKEQMPRMVLANSSADASTHTWCFHWLHSLHST